MRAVDAIMECLKAEGVDVVFGIPGGANLPTYDAIYDADIRHVLVRHEPAAATPPRATPRPPARSASRFATSGPGATNLVTAIADAMMDSVPTVFITGQVRTDLLGTDGFQEADIIGITMPIVKHSFLVTDPREIPRVRSTRPSTSPRTGRPGPVLVDIPQDLSRADIDYEPVDRAVELPGYQPTTEGNTKQIRIAAKALANARRPVLYAGGGVINANASEELRELARRRPLPGHLHADGPRRLPGAARAVARHARHARHPHRQLRDGRGRPDRRDRRPLRRPHHRQALRVRAAREVHPHRHRPGRDLQERPGPHPDRRRRQERPAEADPRVPGAADRPAPPRRVVAADRRAGRSEYPLRYEDSHGRRDQAAVHDRGDATRRPSGDAIITSDVGQHQMWAAQYYDFDKPRRWINSGGLGHDGLRPAGRDRRQGRLPRRSWSSASPATARC